MDQTNGSSVPSEPHRTFDLGSRDTLDVHNNVFNEGPLPFTQSARVRDEGRTVLTRHTLLHQHLLRVSDSSGLSMDVLPSLLRQERK